MPTDDLQKFMESIEWNSVLNECDDAALMDDLFLEELDAPRRRRSKSNEISGPETEYKIKVLQRRRFFEELRDEILICFEAKIRPTVDQVLKYLQRRHPDRIAEADVKPLRIFIRQIKQSTLPGANDDAERTNEESFAPATDSAPRIGQPSSVFILDPVTPCKIPNCLCRK